jgi:hypothetical protein
VRHNRCPIFAQKAAERLHLWRILPPAQATEIIGISGAGEGIRTLDPNLGNLAACCLRMSQRLEVFTPPHPGGRFAQSWLGHALLGTRCPRHDLVQVGLLEHGVPLNHADA